MNVGELKRIVAGMELDDALEVKVEMLGVLVHFGVPYLSFGTEAKPSQRPEALVFRACPRHTVEAVVHQVNTALTTLMAAQELEEAARRLPDPPKVSKRRRTKSTRTKRMGTLSLVKP